MILKIRAAVMYLLIVVHCCDKHAQQCDECYHHDFPDGKWRMSVITNLPEVSLCRGVEIHKTCLVPRQGYPAVLVCPGWRVSLGAGLSGLILS